MANHGIQFIIQIILARLLLPEHFGMLGIIFVLLAISNSIVDSGFSQALIRDQNTSQDDYSTVFYFNLFLALVMYGVLNVFAHSISVFFGVPQLTLILRILSFVLIINSLAIIQRVMIIKNVDFKTLTKVNIIAAITSGCITISLAILGYGVWSLVINILSMQFIQMLLLFSFNKWVPSLTFKIQSFKKFFRFGYKLLLSGLLDTFYNNIYFVLIGRFYSTIQLGYYTNAVKFTDITSKSISISIQRVTYPVLSNFQEDKEHLNVSFRKLIRTSAFINFPLMIGLAAIANPLFYLIFGEKWMPSIVYFQLLCLAGMLYPIHAINLNILQVKGRSDLFLLIEIIKKAVLTILLILSLLFDFGIFGLIIAAVLNSYISLFINTYFSAKEIAYSAKNQLSDILPILIISIIMGIFVYLVGVILPSNHLIKIFCQIIIGFMVYIAASKIAKIKEFYIAYNMILSLIMRHKLTEVKSNGGK